MIKFYGGNYMANNNRVKVYNEMLRERQEKIKMKTLQEHKSEKIEFRKWIKTIRG